MTIMNKSIPAAVALFLIAIMSSCQTMRMTAIPGPDYQVLRDRGDTFGLMSTDEIDIGAKSFVHKQFLAFYLHIRNKTEKAILIDDAEVEVSEGDLTAWHPVKVHRAEEFYKMEEGAIIAGQVLLAISAGLSSAVAGYRTSTTTGTIGGAPYYATTTTYDRGAAQAAFDRDMATMESYSNNSQAYLEFLRANLLYPTDILPGKDYTGLVFSAPEYVQSIPEGKAYVRFRIRIGGRIHEFIFQKTL